MTKEDVKLILKKKSVQILIVGLVAIIIGLLVGYEYRGYVLKKDFEKAFSGVFSDVGKVSEADTVKDTPIELETGQSFEDNGLTLTVTEVQRSDTDVTLSDQTTRDSKIGFKVKVENKTKEDKYFDSSNFALKSRVNDDKLTKVNFFMSDTKNFTPELESNNLIDGAVLEGWFTYFLPKEIQNSDLQVVYNGDNVKVKYRLK